MWGDLIGAAGALGGAAIGAFGSNKASKRNAKLQKEFAQHGITWRVNDAKRAGIHPLYAIGAPAFSASPSYTGDNYIGRS